MNILVVNQFASSPEYSTGAGERHYYLAKKLADKNNFTIISGGYNHLFYKCPNLKSLFTKELIKGGAFYWVKLRRYNGEKLFERVVSWFEFLFKLFLFPIKKEQKPDLVLVSSMSILPIFYAIYLKKRFKIPFVLEIRDIWPLTPIQLGGHSKYHPLMIFLKFIEKLAYKKCDSVISLLPSFSFYIENVYNIKKDIIWIPNAIETSSSVDFEYVKHIPKQKFNIVYVGALGVANSMSVFIDAAQQLKIDNDIQLFIVGNGPERSKLIEKAKNLDNVTFIPKVPKDKVHSILQNASLCFISWHDLSIYNYGVSANKYNDYMLAKKPIISVSNIQDDPVVLADCGMRVRCGDVNELVSSILEMKKMTKSDLDILGVNGYNYLLKNNTYDSISTKYNEFLKNTILDFRHK